MALDPVHAVRFLWMGLASCGNVVGSMLALRCEVLLVYSGALAGVCVSGVFVVPQSSGTYPEKSTYHSNSWEVLRLSVEFVHVCSWDLE